MRGVCQRRWRHGAGKPEEAGRSWMGMTPVGVSEREALRRRTEQGGSIDLDGRPWSKLVALPCGLPWLPWAPLMKEWEYGAEQRTREARRGRSPAAVHPHATSRILLVPASIPIASTSSEVAQRSSISTLARSPCNGRIQYTPCHTLQGTAFHITSRGLFDVAARYPAYRLADTEVTGQVRDCQLASSRVW